MSTKEIEAGIELANLSIKSGRIFERQYLIGILENELKTEDAYFYSEGIQYAIDLIKGLPE